MPVVAGNDSEKEEFVRFLETSMQGVDDLPSRRSNMMQAVAMLRELKAEAGGSDGNAAE